MAAVQQQRTRCGNFEPKNHHASRRFSFISGTLEKLAAIHLQPANFIELVNLAQVSKNTRRKRHWTHWLPGHTQREEPPADGVSSRLVTVNVSQFSRSARLQRPLLRGIAHQEMAKVKIASKCGRARRTSIASAVSDPKTSQSFPSLADPFRGDRGVLGVLAECPGMHMRRLGMWHAHAERYAIPQREMPLRGSCNSELSEADHDAGGCPLPEEVATRLSAAVLQHAQAMAHGQGAGDRASLAPVQD